MVTRRYGREWALQLLVQFDLAAPDSLPAAIAAFWEQQAQLEVEDLEEDKRNAKVIFTSTDPKVLAELADIRAFTEERVNGVWSEHDSLDAQIEPFLENCTATSPRRSSSTSRWTSPSSSRPQRRGAS